MIRTATCDEKLHMLWEPAFIHVPDNDRAWKDLHKLTRDKVGILRSRAANALGIAFSHIPDKDEAPQKISKGKN